MSSAALRVAFLHPDLGLGGAERLIVDAAAGLAQVGHHVDMYTSHYEPARSFAETRSGAFRVRVAGDWLPTTLFGRFYILFAILRGVWLALTVALSTEQYDVFICDQLAAYVPVLRLLRPRTKVLFYCHFPDQLLAQRTSAVKRLYRAPFDAFEQWATGLAATIVVNSAFTRSVFYRTFPSLRSREVDILYPCIDVPPAALSVTPPPMRPLVFLSINRYERKKAIELALTGFHFAKSSVAPQQAANMQLIIAGGYDTRVAENVEYYEELKAEAAALGLTAAGLAMEHDLASVVPAWPNSLSRADAHTVAYEQVERSGCVTFIRSFTDEQKRALLSAAAAVLYTPTNEHFGIVPLEAMLAGRPVVAVASGGPLESIANNETGFLCSAQPEAFGRCMANLASDEQLIKDMGARGPAHVNARFSRSAFTAKLNTLCYALARGVGPVPPVPCADHAKAA